MNILFVIAMLNFTALMSATAVKVPNAKTQIKLAPKGKRIDYLVVASLDKCQGIDVSQYTLIVSYSTDQVCNPESIEYTAESLTATAPHTKRIVVNSLFALAKGLYVQGCMYQAYIDDEGLFFVQSGPGSLEGKYVYVKSTWLRDDYMRKCGSMLGQSYATSKSITLLVADKLDLNVFFSQTLSAYEVFKRSAHTTCTGHGYII